MITRELKIEIRLADVFYQIDCFEDNVLYEEFLKEYQEIEEQMYDLCEPVLLMEYGVIGPELAREGIQEGTPVLMVLTSIGRGISEYSTKCFAEGDYLKGMLANAMADSALFSLGKEIASHLREECGMRGMGISRRLEAPQDISMEAQSFIFEKTGAGQKCGISITSGYMLDPVKSNAALYLLTEDPEIFMHQHNCRNCNRYDCRGRNIPDIPVRVVDGDETYFIEVKNKESILDVLIARDSAISAVCGGVGRCGKCKIKVLSGYLPASTADKTYFTEEELMEGMRLACKAYPSEPLQISLLLKKETAFEVLSEFSKNANNNVAENDAENPQLGIAIDIGTTTIAVQLLNLVTGKEYSTYSTINHQRKFGADVISRIMASVQGKREELQKLIQEDLAESIRRVVEKAGLDSKQIIEVAIAGNTTMIHLLMGYDCKGLGEFPFIPVNIKQITDTYANIVGDNFLNARVHVLPGISTFVGGDIVAGIYTCGFDRKKEYSLLIDLGTNGEIVLGNQDKILVTSTAAGPAFEGGNIAFGVGSIEGAISGVSIDEQGAHIRTIGDKSPVGICGTGVIESVAELIKAELVDETGYLDEKYYDKGYPLANMEDGTPIVLTKEDIREIQLAKASVRAGVETLFLRYGISKEEVSYVYLAGGFGFKLDYNKAIQIGMFPRCFTNKIKTVGNSSLGGAVEFLINKENRKRVTEISENSQEINLSADKYFNQLYMNAMCFKEENK